jgi:hypothetical protein
MPKRTVLTRHDMPRERAIQILGANPERLEARVSVLGADGRDRSAYVGAHPAVKTGTGFPLRVSDGWIDLYGEQAWFVISDDPRVIGRAVEVLDTDQE